MQLEGSKCQRLDEHDNKEENGLDDEEENVLYMEEDKINDGRYVILPFVPLLSLSHKVSYYLSDIDERIKSLKYIVCISKICYLRSANFAFEFPGKKDLKTQKTLYKPPRREIRVSLGFHSFHNFRHH